MKIYIIILMLLSSLFFTSCEDWLSLQPEGQTTEEQLFKTGDGYRTVLNGLYKSMAARDLYGGELCFSMVDCISQQYNLELMVKGYPYTQKHIAAGAFIYDDIYVRPIIERIWKSAFNIIANANSLIQNTESAPSDLFAKGETERKMILGEAYACRALMHFDLLRLFAPARVNDDKKVYVPYVENYPDIHASRISVEPFLEKVIADLKQARELVAEFDTSDLGKGVSSAGKTRFYNEFKWDVPGYNDYSVESFFKGRGYRLSYYAITALLSRVYQYAGRDDDAFKAAEEVMTYELKTTYSKYPFFSIDDYSEVRTTVQFESKRNLKIVSNLIFAVYNEKAYEDYNLRNCFWKDNTGGIRWLIINLEAQKTFYTSDGLKNEFDQDYRSSAMIFYPQGDSRFPVSGKWYISDNEEVRDKNITIMPVIRSTEMRYIMAEYYARKGNFGEAQNILNQIRQNRGCTESVKVTDWNSFIRELICDARREWISEGQLFYLYKRLNAAIDFGRGVVRPLSRGEYLLPIPDDQIL
ncbi:RagB/SusD family nutrient uptake outer membrane protein [Gabonibacter massiliensis]|uniref:RagB/SusD family nutrient uptake outer membrane protein n=1 Tax=Gabonibacter massiliensis TaxID=1720195 RepID=UPI00073F4EDB|nr:RagB/SusD family nutrient uptake outer membrane protein [Gabonibacter massiliensis]